jgi:hypothetical protein
VKFEITAFIFASLLLRSHIVCPWGPKRANL